MLQISLIRLETTNIIHLSCLLRLLRIQNNMSNEKSDHNKWNCSDGWLIESDECRCWYLLSLWCKMDDGHMTINLLEDGKIWQWNSFNGRQKQLKVSKRCDGRRRISSSARKQMDLLHYNYNTTFIIDTRKQMDLFALQQHLVSSEARSQGGKTTQQ